MQQWEKQEDNQIPLTNQDILDRWSSDGGSVSSSSSSDYSSDEISNESINDTLDIESFQETDVTFSQAQILKKRVARQRKMHLLRRAQYYTISEGLEMALDRWQNYRHQCRRFMRLLRCQLTSTYVPHAIKQFQTKNQVISESSQQSKHYQDMRLYLEHRALRKYGKHPIKVSNLRYNAYMSKFAIMCSQVAPWRRTANTHSSIGSMPHNSSSSSLPGLSSQPGAVSSNLNSSLNLQSTQSSLVGPRQCKYRDPTTTTWEKHCTKMAIPLMNYCRHHIVLLK
ncbi:Golgin subfamily A member 7 [Cichlidogyrus casuarinus]|uniref:Golgin subfamily A member 7 n=1 Tax=Cichlidogyrus casuarinus TaxID=1844966 RepID=A0ABD2QMK1_9PLAT